MALSSLVLAACTIAFVQGLPTGPPLVVALQRTAVCVNLIPASTSPHIFQGGQYGYEIYTDLNLNSTVNMYTYMSNVTYQVTIRGNMFRGFLVQARDPSGTAIGTFIPLDNTTQQLLTDCSLAGVDESATIAHINPNRVSFPYQTFNWTAPSDGDGYVRIWYTLVPRTSEYYGPLIAPLNTSQPSAPPSYAPEDYPLTRRYPAGCTPSSCDVFVGVAINPENTNFLNIYMEANAQRWVAAGFSASQNMFSADVVVCTLDPETMRVTAQDTYNAPARTRNNVVDTVQNTVLLGGNYTNGRIRCVVAKAILGVDVPNQDINLNTDGLYVLYARGNTGTPEQIGGHASGEANRAATDGQVNPAAAAVASGVRTAGTIFSIFLAVLVTGITVLSKL